MRAGWAGIRPNVDEANRIRVIGWIQYPLTFDPGRIPGFRDLSGIRLLAKSTRISPPLRVWNRPHLYTRHLVAEGVVDTTVCPRGPFVEPRARLQIIGTPERYDPIFRAGPAVGVKSRCSPSNTNPV